MYVTTHIRTPHRLHPQAPKHTLSQASFNPADHSLPLRSILQSSKGRAHSVNPSRGASSTGLSVDVTPSTATDLRLALYNRSPGSVLGTQPHPFIYEWQLSHHNSRGEYLQQRL